MNRYRTATLACLALIANFALPAAASDVREDILIADFEGETYGEWKSTGEAFGPGPAAGTLEGQMEVSGFEGMRLVNSFYKGDDTLGTLTSPPFKVERKHLNFLIGGGKYPGETCINLLVDGKIVRSATGPNDVQGGSERLEWHTWDVAEFDGKAASLEIIDARKGGWGHINVDHIVQGNRKLQAEPAVREFVIEHDYLHLPVKNRATQRRMRFVVEGQTVREFDIELADAEPDLFVFSDVSALRGKSLRIEVDRLPGDSRALENVELSDELPAMAELYHEKHRPQFHFTSRRGWLNDPNGLVFRGGLWHLFYQHNPYGIEWGNMHWGHAVSEDLFQWRELPLALYPQRHGDWCFSGSAVLDKQNTSGWRRGDAPPLVAAYTSTGRGECIAYSLDGRAFTEFEGNPVVKHVGRDPKLLWHEPSKQWVMAVYTEADGKQWIAFHTSPDLKKWTYQSRIEGFFECPDLFELPIDGKADQTKWVLYAADGQYVLGAFDGKVFKKESGKHVLWHGNFYAAQTFSDAPSGRRIQIGWGRGITFPGMPFNQQMTVPVELTLRSTPDGARMFAEPVKELEKLRGKVHAFRDIKSVEGEQSLEGITHDLLDIEAELRPGEAASCGLIVHGVKVAYDAIKHELSCQGMTAPLKPIDGVIRLRILVDRGSFEIFANRGQSALSVAVVPPEGERGVMAFSKGGAATVQATAHELSSAWSPRDRPAASSR